MMYGSIDSYTSGEIWQLAVEIQDTNREMRGVEMDWDDAYSQAVDMFPRLDQVARDWDRMCRREVGVYLRGEARG